MLKMDTQISIGLPEEQYSAPRNENVDKINEMIMTKFPGQGKTYLSADSVAEEDLNDAYPIDFLELYSHCLECHHIQWHLRFGPLSYNLEI